MKKIWIDFNGPNLNRPRLSELQMDYFKLFEGEKVMLYSDDIQV